jgi:hypothetical protein
MIQRAYILDNIADAREELEAIEKALANPDYGEFDFRGDLSHAYHHLNFAWNARNASDEELTNLSDSNDAKWSKFPVGEIQEYE